MRRSLREKERQLKVLLQGPQARESRDADVSREARIGVYGGYMRRLRSEVEAGGGSGGCGCGNGGETGHVLPGNWTVVRAAFTVGEGDGGATAGVGIG
jgi:hypothetical protein